MIKKIHIILVLLLGSVLLFTHPAKAHAGDLEVLFETGDLPLFSEANFLPGQGVTRWIKVTNYSSETKKIAIEAINVDNSDNMGDVLSLQIKEGDTIHFDNTLTNFFQEGEFFLSSLDGEGGHTQYDLTVDFLPGANNDFQGKKLYFDILVGFQSTEGGTTGGTLSVSGGFPSGLTIIEKTIFVELGETGVYIEWDTSYASTSRVIYAKCDPIYGESHTLNLSDNADVPPLYGYEHTTQEQDDDPKVLDHSVLIDPLESGITYCFRCISHASPDSISREYSFTTLAIAGEVSEAEESTTQPQESHLEETSSSGVSFSTESEPGAEDQGDTGAVKGEEDVKEETTEEITEITQRIDESEQGRQDIGSMLLANLSSAWKGFKRQWFWWLLIILLLIVIYFYLRKRKEEKEKEKRQQKPLY